MYRHFHVLQNFCHVFDKCIVIHLSIFVFMRGNIVYVLSHIMYTFTWKVMMLFQLGGKIVF